MKSVAVIGGGASGLFAALTAAERADALSAPIRITVYEALPRVGKKLAVTGNGRCNLTNTELTPAAYFGDAELIRRVTEDFSNEDAVRFFEAHGLFTHADAAGRVYPACNQASAVLDCLRFACAAAGVEIRTDSPIRSIAKRAGFLLNEAERADRVIFACGSSAGDGMDSLRLLRDVGVKTIPFAPALTPLKLTEDTKPLKGVRANGEIRLYAGKQLVAKDRGEIQYTDYGVSGIPAMQISAAGARVLSSVTPCSVSIDSAPSMSGQALFSFVSAQSGRAPQTPAGVVLNGLLPRRLADVLLRAAGMKPELPIGQYAPADYKRLCSVIKHRAYTVDRPMGFRYAQVAAGGVPSGELDWSSLSCKNAPGLYVCGEAVDVHGLCGGFNLQWAWSSAYRAGRRVIEDMYRD